MGLTVSSTARTFICMWQGIRWTIRAANQEVAHGYIRRRLTQMMLIPKGARRKSLRGSDGLVVTHCRAPVAPDVRRALGYVAPYWRRWCWCRTFIVSTALALFLPYLFRAFIDRALVGRDSAVLTSIVVQFFASRWQARLNVTADCANEVSADILFDMRLALFAPAGITAAFLRAHASGPDVLG